MTATRCRPCVAEMPDLERDGAVFRELEAVAMPTTFLVDADGVIVHRHAGLLTEQQLRDLLDDHLGMA